jgi:hypothetical protein
MKEIKKKYAKEVCRNKFGSVISDENYYNNFANKNADNLKRCSCWMCGNPRKYFKERTLQEKKLEHSYNCDME